MNCEKIAKHIVEWLDKMIEETGQDGFVVGVSGGVDSAVVSTLCAMTRKPVILVSMPINQKPDQVDRANEHMASLAKKFTNVRTHTVDLTKILNTYKEVLPAEAISDLALVNTSSRIRMIALYAFANSSRCLVVGTGNKVEDAGIGFFTKYGDGGVDISPIGDLLKSAVRDLAKYLEVAKSIYTSDPTDGLWGDSRTDEDQIGASYPELERAMELYIRNPACIQSNREREVLSIYTKRHRANAHKMRMPPVCYIHEA